MVQCGRRRGRRLERRRNSEVGGSHSAFTAEFENVISEWKQYAVTLQRQVRIVTQREVSEGLAVDVDENGGLVIELADGTQKTIVYGDCFHQ